MLIRWQALAAIALLGACAPGGSVTDVDAPQPDRTIAGITYRAETHVLETFPIQFRTIVEARNDTGAPADVWFPDGCVVLLRVYRESARQGDPAWDQSHTVACTAAIVARTLEPGDTTILGGGTIRAAEVLGDSLPAGRYYLTAVLRPNGRPIELAAGDAALAR